MTAGTRSNVMAIGEAGGIVPSRLAPMARAETKHNEI